MVTAERQSTSRLIALDGESRILGYTQAHDPKAFLHELGGTRRARQVRIYEVCPPTVDDMDHYYDFEATCLLRRDRSQESLD